MTKKSELEDAEKEKDRRAIPEEPKDTGSSGTQETSVLKAYPEKDALLHGLPITRTVTGLAATRSRAMGGEVVANLMAGSMEHLSQDLQQTRSELRSTRKELEESNKELTNCKVESAVLKERVKSINSRRHLNNISTIAGMTLVAISIEFYRNTYDKISYIVGGLGVLLILFGWFSYKEGAEE